MNINSFFIHSCYNNISHPISTNQHTHTHTPQLVKENAKEKKCNHYLKKYYSVTNKMFNLFLSSLTSFRRQTPLLSSPPSGNQDLPELADLFTLAPVTERGSAGPCPVAQSPPRAVSTLTKRIYFLANQRRRIHAKVLDSWGDNKFPFAEWRSSLGFHHHSRRGLHLCVFLGDECVSQCVCTGLCVCIRCVSVPMTPQRSKIKNSERILCINLGKGGDTSMFLFYVN